MFNQAASPEAVSAAQKALEANGYKVLLADNKEEAKTKVLELLPKQAQVMTMTSVTLTETGLAEAINDSGEYTSVKHQLSKMDRNTQNREMQALGAAPEYAIGSVHAVTQDGKILVASNSGSQLPAYAYGAGQVIWVVGTQKIVADEEEGRKRIYEYILPKESERARKAYGVPGSEVKKLLTFYKEFPGRITMVLVNEVLGF